MNALIINSHQKHLLAVGKLNKSVEDIIEKTFLDAGGIVTKTKIEDGYNPEEEVEKHLNADVVIIQSPVYWFSLPWIGKKYIEDVLMAGLSSQKMCSGDGRSREDPSKQYGSGGKMQGKKFMLSLTWNAPRSAFGDKSQHLSEGRTVDDVFFPVEASYRFCGFEIVPSFSFFDVIKNLDFEKGSAEIKSHLKEHFKV